MVNDDGNGNVTCERTLSIYMAIIINHSKTIDMEKGY